MSKALDSIYHIVLTMVYIAALSLLIFANFANLVENRKYKTPYWLPYLCFKFDSPPSCSFCSCFLGWLCNYTKSNVLIHHINDIFFVIMDLDLMSLKTCYCVIYALIKVSCSLMALRKWHVFCWYTDSVLQVHIHIHSHTHLLCTEEEHYDYRFYSFHRQLPIYLFRMFSYVWKCIHIFSLHLWENIGKFVKSLGIHK